MLSTNRNHWERHRNYFKEKRLFNTSLKQLDSRLRQTQTQRTTSSAIPRPFLTNNRRNNYETTDCHNHCQDIISFGNFEFVYDKTFLDNLRQLNKELKIGFSTEESRNKSRIFANSIEEDVEEVKKQLVDTIKDKIKIIDLSSDDTPIDSVLSIQRRNSMTELTQNDSNQKPDSCETSPEFSQKSDYDYESDNEYYDPSLSTHTQLYMKSLTSNSNFKFSDSNSFRLTQSVVSVTDDSGIGSDRIASNRSNCQMVEPSKQSQICDPNNKLESDLKILNRHKWENTIYCIEKGIVLKESPENKVRTQRKRKKQLKFVLQKILVLIESNVFCTKRDLYYQNVMLFNKSQRVVDEIVDDLASSLKTSRYRLHIVSSTRGLVFGHLTFHNTNGVLTDCLSSPNGINIPNDTQRIDRIRSNAHFVLIIEKDATFQQLIDLRIQERYPLIMVTGHGYPDLNTRAFIQMLWNTLEIPIFGLVDGDAHGLEILCTFRHGSLALSYTSPILVAPVIRWLGILPTDIIDYKLSPSVQITLNERDRKKIEDLKNRIYLKSNEEWTKQLNILLKIGKKVEIQSLAQHWPTFLLDVYLPAKIRYGKWI